MQDNYIYISNKIRIDTQERINDEVIYVYNMLGCFYIT